MRSLPVLEAALLLFLFGIMMVPMLRLTNGQPPALHDHTYTPVANTGSAACYATIRAAHPHRP